MHFQHARGPSDIPSAPVQCANHVLTLELLARFLQRQLVGALRACRQQGVFEARLGIVSHTGQAIANRMPNLDRLSNCVIGSFDMSGSRPSAHERVHAPQTLLHLFVCTSGQSTMPKSDRTYPPKFWTGRERSATLRRKVKGLGKEQTGSV